MDTINTLTAGVVNACRWAVDLVAMGFGVSPAQASFVGGFSVVNKGALNAATETWAESQERLFGWHDELNRSAQVREDLERLGVDPIRPLDSHDFSLGCEDLEPFGIDV